MYVCLCVCGGGVSQRASREESQILTLENHLCDNNYLTLALLCLSPTLLSCLLYCLFPLLTSLSRSLSLSPYCGLSWKWKPGGGTSFRSRFGFGGELGVVKWSDSCTQSALEQTGRGVGGRGGRATQVTVEWSGALGASRERSQLHVFWSCF